MAKRKTGKSKPEAIPTGAENGAGVIKLDSSGRVTEARFAGYYRKYSRRSPEAREQEERERRASDQAKQERIRQSCEKCHELLADSSVRMYWLGQAQAVMATETSYQGLGGACLQYEWPRDKAMVYAVMAIWLDECSNIKILPEHLRQTDFYKVNKNVGNDMVYWCPGLTAEFLSYIEADLKAAGQTEPPGTVKKDNVKISRPLFPKQWASVFGVSTSTIRRWKKDKTYSFTKMSERKWALPIQELPAEYLQKYKAQSK